MRAPSFDVVVPTIGRPSLGVLLAALADADGPLPGRIVLVDDRRGRSKPLVPDRPPRRLAERLEVRPGRGAGPAAARNVGWRASRAPWIAFLDDDVVPGPDWLARLADDLDAAAPDVAGSQGRLTVPLPAHRRPTDWERNVRALEGACWATADMAYRRAALWRVGGFDERFRRAYREDADLGLRMRAARYRIVTGRRRSFHPVPPADAWISVRLQAGNADDVLMRALHGPRWRQAAHAPAGRLARHLATTAAGLVAVLGGVLGYRRLARLGAVGFLAGTAELGSARIVPGPRTPPEVATMIATTLVLPAAATLQWIRGLVRLRRLLARPGPVGRPDAVLLDRDGTLVEDVPYNGDPARVRPLPGVRAALDRLRAAGVALAVVSNQSGVGRRLITLEQVQAVNRRIEELLGPLGAWAVCPHAPGEGCACRKPAPGLLRRAAAALGVRADRCAVIGDIGADVDAARAVGARAILVPTPRTLPEEIRAAPEVASNLGAATDLLLET